MFDTKDLVRLIKLCPDIALSNKDIKQIIESESFNGVITSYKKQGTKVKLVEVEEGIFVSPNEEDEELDNEKEVAEHLAECEDNACECKSVFDE